MVTKTVKFCLKVAAVIWLLFFFAFCFASAQVQIARNVQLGGTGAVSAGVVSINTIAGAFTFSGSGVSCSSTTCTFTGVTSVNGLTGPALTIVGDSSLTVTPSGSNINLHATGAGGSGVQYNAANTTYYIVADSIGGVAADSCFETALPSDTSPITAGSVSGGTASFTGTNTWGSGCVTILTGFTGGAAGLNGQLCVVSATGLSGSAFQCPVTGGAIGSTGTGQAQARYNLTGRLTYDMPYTAGHGTVINASTSNQTLAQMNSAYATGAHLHSPAVTGNPAFLIIYNFNQDFYNGRTDTQVEGDLQTLWQTARADNWTGIIQCTDSGLHTTNATQIAYWNSVNRWIPGQGPTNANVIAGKYFDRLNDQANVLPNGYDAQYFGQTGGAPGHLTDLGAWISAVYLNLSFSAQGTMVGTNTNGARNFGGTVWVNGPTVSSGLAGPQLGVQDPTTGALTTTQIYNNGGTGIPITNVNGDLMNDLQVISGNAAFVMPSNAYLGWNDSSGAPGAYTHAPDSCLDRVSSGVIGFATSCTAGGVTGSGQATQFLAKTVKYTQLYSAAGTALPTCNSGANGTTAVVSDATAPTFLGAYTSGGAVESPVLCNGSGWVTY